MPPARVIYQPTFIDSLKRGKLFDISLGSTQYTADIKNTDSMEVIVVLIITGAAATFFIRRSQKRRIVRARLHQAFLEQLHSIGDFITTTFSVQACSRCHETRMKLREVSTTLPSIEYECLNCRKKSRAPGALKEALELNTRISALGELTSSLNRISKPRQRIRGFSIVFSTPAAPFPLAQDQR